MWEKVTFATGRIGEQPKEWESMNIDERLASPWKPRTFHRSGFWKTESVVTLAKKYGIVGELEIKFVQMDTSGKGRTYTERKVMVTV